MLLSFDVADAKLQALADEPDGAHKPGEISASFDQKKTHLEDISRVENTWKGLHGKLLQWKVSVFVGEV